MDMYFFLFQLLSLCHIIQGHQVYIHPVHLVCIVMILATCCVLVWAIEEYWHSEWTVLYLSLLVRIGHGPQKTQILSLIYPGIGLFKVR